MDPSADLFTKAKKLPLDQQEDLALRLLKSLPDWGNDDAPLFLSDDDERELARRSERHSSNPTAAVTAAEALNELETLANGFSANDRAD
jgi:hypothetical protein